jgi:hypothetical protein
VAPEGGTEGSLTLSRYAIGQRVSLCGVVNVGWAAYSKHSYHGSSAKHAVIFVRDVDADAG